MQCKYYGNCKHQNESCKSNTALLKCVYGLNEYCTEKAWEIDALREENKELKRLLRLAVDALKKVSEENHSYCLSDGICDECDFTAEGKKNWCKWKHTEEAMKILEDNNVKV